MIDIALGMMAALSVEEKEPVTCGFGGDRRLRAWGRKKVILAIHADEETVIECRPKCSSSSIGPVENMNKELCGFVRCFRIYFRSMVTWEITTESPLLPWLVRHCGWILSRYAARSNGWRGYSGRKGRDCTAGISIFGEATWCKQPNTGELTKLDDWRTAIWLEKSDRSDEHIIGLETGGGGQALEREGVEDGHQHTVASSAR